MSAVLAGVGTAVDVPLGGSGVAVDSPVLVPVGPLIVGVPPVGAGADDDRKKNNNKAPTTITSRTSAPPANSATATRPVAALSGLEDDVSSVPASGGAYAGACANGDRDGAGAVGGFAGAAGTAEITGLGAPATIVGASDAGDAIDVGEPPVAPITIGGATDGTTTDGSDIPNPLIVAASWAVAREIGAGMPSGKVDSATAEPVAVGGKAAGEAAGGAGETLVGGAGAIAASAA